MAPKAKQNHMWCATRASGEVVDFFTYVIAKDWAGPDGTVTPSKASPSAKNQDASLRLAKPLPLGLNA